MQKMLFFMLIGITKIFCQKVIVITYAINCLFFSSAAAYSQIEQHEKAVADAKSAIKVDAEYSKAYSRMGYHCFFILLKYLFLTAMLISVWVNTKKQ